MDCSSWIGHLGSLNLARSSWIVHNLGSLILERSSWIGHLGSLIMDRSTLIDRSSRIAHRGSLNFDRSPWTAHRAIVVGRATPIGTVGACALGRKRRAAGRRPRRRPLTILF